MVLRRDVPDRLFCRNVDIHRQNDREVIIRIGELIEARSRMFIDGLNLSPLESIAEPILVTEADPIVSGGRRVVFANQAFEEMSGYRESEVLGKNPAFLQGVETNHESRKRIREALNARKPIRQDVINYDKSQVRYRVQLNISPIRDVTGWVTHFMAIQRNVSRIEQDLQVKKFENERFEKMGEMTKVGFWELELATQRLTWNKQVYAIHGLNPAHPVDTERAVTFYRVKDRETLLQLANQAVKTGKTFAKEVPISDTLGTEKWVSLNGTPIVNKKGQTTHIFGTIQDISETKFREIERKLVLETARMGLWTYDCHRDILTWDEKLFEIYGTHPDEFSGNFSAWSRCIHPDDLGPTEEVFQKCIANKSDFHSEFRVVRKNDEISYVKAAARVFYADNGLPNHIIGVNWDVTAERLAEQQKLRQKRIADHQSQLASIGQLAAGVGHEVNNPLAIAITTLESLKKSHAFSEPDQRRMEILSDSLWRIESIVSGLRDFSRVNDKQEVFTLEEIIRGTLNLVQHIFEKDGVQIEVQNLLGKTALVEGNKTQLQQVIMNLLTNARDATEGCPTRLIRIDGGTEKDFHWLTVTDNGHGIPEEAQSRIFDSFFTTKEVGKGVGIGLSLCHSIMTEHKGEITVQSTAGSGTQFKLKLPISKKLLASLDCHNYPSPKDQSLLKKRILVADDERNLREILVEYLEEWGHICIQAVNGEQAWDLFRERPQFFDLVLSDIKMPVLNGIELIKKIKESYPNSQTKTILTTGGIERSQEAEINSDAIIYKPFTQEGIQKSIKKVFA
jgi:PAS domain S-box-containing protein